MQNRWLKWGILALVIGGAAVLFYKKVYLPKSTYNYETAKRGDLNLTVFGIGNVSAKNIHPIASNTGGKILKIFKDQGESVKKGELIATLDPVDLPDQLAQAKALREKSRFETEASRQELRQLEAQQELARANFRRYETLNKRGYAAQEEYDKARTDLKVVQAQIAAAKARISSSLAEQKRSQKSIDALQQKIDRLRVLSPMDGTVVSKDAEAGQTIAAQQPIVTVVDPQEVWVKAYIDERISGQIAKDQKAQIVLRSKAGQKLPGIVARIEAESDPVTEERVVDVAFDKVPIPFYLNEQAEVTIRTGQVKGAILVPLTLIRHDGVWVYRKGEAHFVKLEILGKNDRFAAVKGLREGEKILIPDPHKKPLFEGADIRL
ncbi:efflux RND transporter periplasmic adaptor subunit [Nitratifractor sp.]